MITPEPEPPTDPFWKRMLLAAVASGVCSALFLTLYPLVNRYTATRTDVGMLYFPFELAIPLVPVFIIPYMSIDLLYGVTPFVCTSRKELFRLTARMFVAITLACACFLALPLQCAFPREPVPGVFGPIFDFLRANDQPFNMVPSLHITLAFILRWTFHHHVRGMVLWAFHIWFALISVSTILCHQHHSPDLIAGLALALLVFHMFPSFSRTDLARFRPGRRSRRLATRYGAGALACWLVAALAGGWWLLLLWPSFALANVAMGYGFAGPFIFRKRPDGLMSIPTIGVMLPFFVGQLAYRKFTWRHDQPGINEVAPGFWVGRISAHRAMAALPGRPAVLDLTAEHNAPRKLRRMARQGGIDYFNLPTLDLASPSIDELRHALAWIDSRPTSEPVVVCCALGFGRSVAVAAAMLVRRGRCMSLDEAVALIRKHRGQAHLSAEVSENVATFLNQKSA